MTKTIFICLSFRTVCIHKGDGDGCNHIEFVNMSLCTNLCVGLLLTVADSTVSAIFHPELATTLTYQCRLCSELSISW